MLDIRKAGEMIDMHALEEILLRFLHGRDAPNDDAGGISAADAGGHDEVALLHRRALSDELHVQRGIVVAGDDTFRARLLDDVLPMIAVAGVTIGFVGLQTPGLVLLALLPIAGLGALREMHVIHSDILLVLAFVLAATMAYELILVASLMASGGGYDILAALRSAVIPAAIVNVAITPPAYMIMRLAKSPSRRNRLAY